MNKLVNGELLLREKFSSPSREFGILPFWFWNGDMEYVQMDSQIHEFFEKGLPGFIIHARFGIRNRVGYLTDSWFEKVEYAVRKASEYGLQVWIYDEYNWPSGTAGQTLMAENESKENHYLELKIIPTSNQYFTFLEGTDSRYFDLERSEPIYACAIQKEDLAQNQDHFLDLMPNLCFEKIVAWEAPQGEWLLFYFMQRNAHYYADTLNPEVSADFISATHQKYAEKLSHESFAYLSGFYTDEPAMLYFETGMDNYVLPWTGNLLHRFSEEYGYDLRPLLPHLFVDINGRTSQIRLDYYRLLARQYNESFFQQIAGWCKINDKLFTGHLLYEESVRRHAKTNGNLFDSWRYFDMTGVDHLYPRVGSRNHKEEHVALKLASSAAHQLGSVRLLCESMGGFYWNCTIQRMKWVADWEYVLGVNLLNPHGFHYSIEGDRKRDWPPSQFYHHGWWEYYGIFNTYLSRLGYLLSGGHHVAKIAILYPINSIWANYTPQKPNEYSQFLEQELNHLADALLRIHYDYDFIEEKMLTQCKIQDGRLEIRGEQYELILLPPLTHISLEALELLEQFADDGGHILADFMLPSRDVVSGKDLSGRISRLFARPTASFVRGNGFHQDPDLNCLRTEITAHISPDVEIDNEEIFCLHRVKDGQDFYFVVNPTRDTRRFRITLRGRSTPSHWDLLDGTIQDILVYTARGNSTWFEWELSPYGSALFGTVPYCDAFLERHTETAPFHVIQVSEGVASGYYDTPDDVYPLTPPFDFSVEGKNALVLSHFHACLAEEAEDPWGDLSTWMDCEMGAWEPQYKAGFDSKDYPVNLWYAVDFSAEYLPKTLDLLIDGFKGSGYRLYVNGFPAESPPHKIPLDAEIQAVDISSLLRKGANRIVILLTVTKKTDGLLDMIKLMGDFCVDGKDILVPPRRTIQTGDWCEQGYPYFSGIGLYRTDIKITLHDDSVYILRFHAGDDAVSVSVNQSEYIVRPWAPYQGDITSLLHTGMNTITFRIANTLSNLLQKSLQPSGLTDAKINCYKLHHAACTENPAVT